MKNTGGGGDGQVQNQAEKKKKKERAVNTEGLGTPFQLKKLGAVPQTKSVPKAFGFKMGNSAGRGWKNSLNEEPLRGFGDSKKKGEHPSPKGEGKELFGRGPQPNQHNAVKPSKSRTSFGGG